MASIAIQTLVFILSVSPRSASILGAREFVRQQRFLACCAIPVISELSQLPDHTMAGDQHCDRVMPYGGAHCSHGGRLPDLARDLPVSRHMSCRDPQQCLPNLD